MKKRQSLFPENYVSLISDREIQIEHVSAELEGELESLGGQSVIEDGEIWTIPFDGEEQLAKLLYQLSRLGVLFVDQPAGWPPAAIFRDVRSRQLHYTRFKAVTWSGPGKWSVYES